MRSIQELHTSAVAMQRQGLPSGEVAGRIVDLAQESRFSPVTYRGRAPVIELVFEGEERTIQFTGKNWRVVPTPP